MKGSARFRHRREVADMGKTASHPLKDVTIIQSYRISDLNSEPLNENDDFHSDPNNGQGQLEAQEIKDSPKKRNLNKVEMVTVKGKENNSFKPSFRSLYLPGRNKKDADKQGDSSSWSQKGLNHGLTSRSELGRGSELILMGCTNCYIYVMVCDESPKCPQCRKGDCLLDIFRETGEKRQHYVV